MAKSKTKKRSIRIAHIDVFSEETSLRMVHVDNKGREYIHYHGRRVYLRKVPLTVDRVIAIEVT